MQKSKKVLNKYCEIQTVPLLTNLLLAKSIPNSLLSDCETDRFFPEEIHSSVLINVYRLINLTYIYEAVLLFHTILD